MNGRRTTLLTIAALAMATRCLVLLMAIGSGRLPAEKLPQLRDGATYLAYSQAIAHGRSGFASLSAYDRRVFPGYPVVLAALRAYQWPAIAIALNIVATGVAAVLAALLFADARVGFAMATLTPSYVMYSTAVMTEPLVLAFGLAALYLGRRSRPATAGALLGLTALIRPLAAPLGVAYLVEHRRERRQLAIFVLVCLAVVAAGALWLLWWSGSLTSGIDAYRANRRAYGGETVFTWPFASVVGFPLTHHVPLWKIAYVWAHLLVVLGGIVLLLRERPRPTDALWWLAANTLIVVCIGGQWGFHELHRFIIPGLPPLFYAYRRWMPIRAGSWLALAILSAIIAAVGLGHGW